MKCADCPTKIDSARKRCVPCLRKNAASARANRRRKSEPRRPCSMCRELGHYSTTCRLNPTFELPF